MNKPAYEIAREKIIPHGAVEIRDDKSDAVAYLYNNTKTKHPVLMVFFGKRSKAVVWNAYHTDEQRQKAMEGYFNSRREYANARKPKERKIEVGEIFYTSWGWEQTNIDFYQVVALVGTQSLKVRKIGSEDVTPDNYSWGSGKKIAVKDNFTDDEITVRAKGDYFRVDGHYANKWEGQPVNYSYYA